MTYKLINDITTGTLASIQIKGTNKFIPLDTLNKDYLEYLAWVAEGNTADPADTPPSPPPLTWTDIRADRDSRLVETDWTQTPDVPQETIWKWKTYRQDLREIPQKQTDPTNITWPTKPS